MPSAKIPRPAPRRKRTVLDEATWRQHITQWKASNLSQVDYCQQNDVRIGSFGKWKKRIEGLDHDVPQQFIPVTARSPQESIELEITFASDVSLKLSSSVNPAIVLPWINALRQLA